MEDRKEHWNKVYENKKPTEVSWYEPMPETSLDYIAECKLEKDAAIIDIGGGDSFLAEFLIGKGYTDITVVDISENALIRAKERLGEKAGDITWIVADAAEFEPQRQYDLWHDRAAFHFLTEDAQVKKYLQNVKQAVKPGGFVVMGTFSENGPTKCSGIEIRQYSIKQMQDLFADGFTAMNCKNLDHNTPSGGTQNFTFCSFKRD
ncbi:Methyltransferase domain-containing protein [Salinimicrobium catena]|uniref:Methyltransferase domain-containing protein n=1 Tax=Salinimicrobium catena TaxID=390640 RepID=A0A1H5MXY9_9FLAO|nr:class I SAM-dependent methyltransferase [Salinimicrobium catena]SDL31924.1 Methyltransferase domain-containing protein [Salinimicrobium catena]SEE94020.1 Methyltransferase domain-containing protein [Salinimicrobium catena]